RFTEEGGARGFAFNFEGKSTSAMGLSVEDFDGDGDFDVYRTNFDFEANCLHVSDGKGMFIDEAEEFGLAQPSMDRLGWGGGFFDADCDGDFDLFVANGHVYPQAKEIGMSGWLMQSQLFEAVQENGAMKYVDATARAGTDLGLPRSARGAAFADADSDGDVDVLVVDMDEKPRLLENRTPRRGHWISVRTIGSESNRDGIGAVVQVQAGGKTRSREMRTTQGLYSSHDPRLHFGLGEVDRIELVEVSWPSGRKSRVDHPPIDQPLVMKEPTGASP
ncbi:MAG TPA: ASPIC/UnbV domain-containing protein, partial [bacterium]|nr:ASPIC/UnbV domain-containing protein [bacterium]